MNILCSSLMCFNLFHSLSNSSVRMRNGNQPKICAYIWYHSTLSVKRPLICLFQDNVLALNKRLDHMEWKTEQMERQMDDWDREKGTMDRLTNNTQKAIDELTLVLTLIHVYVKEIGLHYLNFNTCACVQNV